MGIITIISTIISLILCILCIVSLWKIFKVEGQPGWASLIPIYNLIVMCKIGKTPLWYVIMLFIPVINIVFMTLIYINFALGIGKSKGFGIGLLLLPEIFMPIAAFADLKNKKVNKIVYAILTILLGSIGINKFYAGKIKSGILSLVFCWTLIPAILSVAEFITVLTEKADKDGKISATTARRTNVLFGTSLVIFVLFLIGAVIPWESLFTNCKVFTDFNTWVSNIKIGDYAIFGNIIGQPVVTDASTGSSSGVIGAFGTWAMTDVAIFLFILTAVIALCSKIKFNDFIATTTDGIKKILPVAITAMLISIVLVMMVTSGVNITITNWIMSWAKGFNIATVSLASIVGSVLTGDFYYFIATLSVVFTSAVSNADLYGVVALIMQGMYYLMMLIAPTSVGLIIGLYYLDIPYGKWFKYIWKVLLAMLIVLIIAAIIVFALV